MTADDKIRDDINREAAKILALLSGKIDKCEYLKVVLHGTICLIQFVWILFGFKISSYKSEDIKLILSFKNGIIQILMQKIGISLQFTRSDLSNHTKTE